MSISSLTTTEVRSLRFITGVTLGFMVAQLLDWQLAYIMPVMLSMLLSGPTIDVKTGALFIAVILGGCLFGLLLSMSVINYPLLCVLLFGLLLLHIYRAGNNGLSPFAVIMLIMGLMVIPLLGLPSLQLSWMLVKGLATSGLVAVGIAIIFFSVFPVTPDPVPAEPPHRILSADLAAVISTLVILPLMVIFYTLFWVDLIVVLLFSAILAQNVNLAASAKGGAALVGANLLGGVAAVIVYNLLVMAPDPLFLLALIALASAVFAPRIFSDDPIAPLYSSAFSAVLLLVGSSISSETKDASEAFITRIFQIFLAAVYVAGSFALLKRAAVYLRLTAATSTADKGAMKETAIVAELGS
jgi:hypothetical protein